MGYRRFILDSSYSPLFTIPPRESPGYSTKSQANSWLYAKQFTTQLNHSNFEAETHQLPPLPPRLRRVAGLVFGVGSPSRSNLQPRMELFGDARMTAREANAIVQSAFPAAYEWCAWVEATDGGLGWLGWLIFVGGFGMVWGGWMGFSG